MKLVITVEPEAKTITVDRLLMDNSNIIAAYKCANSEAFCILSKATIKLPGSQSNCSYTQYGFVPLNGCGDLRFAASTMRESIESASKCRKVYIYHSMQEMLKTMLSPCN